MNRSCPDLAVTFISAHLCKSKLAVGRPFPTRCATNRLDRTNVTNQSAKSLQITVDSCEKSYKMSTTTHVVIRSRKIVIASLSDCVPVTCRLIDVAVGGCAILT